MREIDGLHLDYPPSPAHACCVTCFEPEGTRPDDVTSVR